MKLYLGTQNDGLFIIDAPPSPAGEGSGLVEWGPNVIAKFYKNDRATQAMAEKMIAAYNASVDPCRHPDPVTDIAERVALGLP